MNTHFGRVTLTIPEGMISTDLPQNLFFHRWSEEVITAQLQMLFSVLQM